METKTYKHKFLKWKATHTDEIGCMRLFEGERPLPHIAEIKRQLSAISEDVTDWWVEETISETTKWSSDEVEGRYATSGICRCSHGRASHNKGDHGIFGTSCFHKNGHDVYCECQAFVQRPDHPSYDLGHVD